MLQKIFEQVNQQADPTIGLVKEGPIFFLVLNKPNDNTFDLKFIDQLMELLDIVENSVGAACLITIGTNAKIFSTGFDLGFWRKHVLNSMHTIAAMQPCLKKLMMLSVPTMCVMSGHAYAGGLILALAHDFRIIAPKAKVCLSEILVGMSLGNAYAEIVYEHVPPSIVVPMLLGKKMKA